MVDMDGEALTVACDSCLANPAYFIDFSLAWAVAAQHIHTSKNTKATLKCWYTLHGYVSHEQFFAS